MSVGTTNAEHSNITLDEVANTLNNGAKVKRLTCNGLSKNDKLMYTLVTESTNEFNNRLDNIMSREIDRVRSGNPSLRIGNKERKLVRKLCGRIVGKATAKLVRLDVYGDLGTIDTELIDSESMCMADDMNDELLVVLNDGGSFLVLCKELCDDPIMDTRAADYK